MTKALTPRISEDFSKAPSDHNILIVGSGYGGAVAASRLARTGQAVTVLERGQEIRPGQYPNDMKSGIGEFQTTLSADGKTYGKKYGLYDVRIADNVNVFVGCGLGGTSLINANVAIEPDADVFEAWPKPYCDRPDLLKEHFARAKQMLGSRPYPAERTLPKLDALKRVADGLHAPFNRLDINVTFEDGHNHAGEWQNACTDCGDCASGCNYGAKNTVLMNYLPDAQKAGAKLFVGADVQTIRRSGDQWSIVVKDVTDGETESRIKVRTLTANVVILAAGTLGSTEILLRSRCDSLTFSDKLGDRFSTNGDIWAFGYNANMRDSKKDDRNPIYSVGAGSVDVSSALVPPCYQPGPCITGMVDLRDPSKPLDKNIVIQEGVMPGALAPIYSMVYPMIEALNGDPFRFGDLRTRMQDVKDLGETLIDNPKDFAQTVYSGPVSRTMPYLVMGHDTAAGALRMKNGRVFVHWPEAGKDATFKHSSAALRKASDNIKAEYLPMPLWEDAFNNRVFAVHPLGGCPMGETAEDGAVNADLQVFDSTGGLHPDLYVMDGAVIPAALGVNPHLTITALAERAVATLAASKKWCINYAPHPPIKPPAPVIGDRNGLLDVLDGIVGLLEGLLETIDENPDDARQIIKSDLDQLLEYIVENFPGPVPPKLPTTQQIMVYAVNGEGLQNTTKPILKQCLDILLPISDAIDDEAYEKAWEHLETMMGDFSPPFEFREKMVGRVSAVGTQDKSPAHDPYGVAAMGPENFRFDAEIKADAIRTALSEHGEFPKIVGKAVWSDDAVFSDSRDRHYEMDGTFKFLVQNHEEIECWNMIYEGNLTPDNLDGETLTYSGIKTLQYRKDSHWWTDLTQLEFDICQGERLIAQGVLKLGLEDVVTQANELEIKYDPRALRSDIFLAYSNLKDFTANNPGKDLPEFLTDREWRASFAKGILYFLHKTMPQQKPVETVEQHYWATSLGRIGSLVLRTYGQFLAYMANFQSLSKSAAASADLPEPKIYEPITSDGAKLRLTRYEGGTKGPVIMAAGMAANASAFATPTVKRNLTQMLVDADFDVWLFDYRGSGALEASLSAFDFDDVATQDWPTAIDTVLANTNNGATDVQVMTHCVGSLIFFMAMLAGETRVRSVISSQLGVHTLTNWFKQMQIDADLAHTVAKGLPESLWPIVDGLDLDYKVKSMAKNGMPFVDPTSPSKSPHVLTLNGTSDVGPNEASEIDQIIDALVWKVPSFSPVPCSSPTCHRVNFFLGPTYNHDQLNQATHDAIKDMFGPVASEAFFHLTKCFGVGHAVPYSKDIDYMEGYANLTMPIHFIVGANNPLVVPESSLRTIAWLKEKNATRVDVDTQYTRKVYENYGHIDCLIGKDAHEHIFPDIVKRFDVTGKVKKSADLA